MICAVFGGAGFIGSHIVDELLCEGHEVRVFDLPGHEREEQSGSTGNVQYSGGNFENPDDYKRAISGSDVVFHLIWSTLPENSNWNCGYDVESNVQKSLKLLDECVQQGIRKVVFISSAGTVYGIPQRAPINEAHPTEPICSYGITKLAFEKYLHLYHHLHGLDYAALRVSNAYGERQNLHKSQGVIGIWLQQIMRGQEVEIWGDGTAVRDYVYVGDVARAFRLAAIRSTRQKVFNVGAGKGISLNDLASRMRTVLKLDFQIRYRPGRTCDVPVNVLDISRSEALLDWRPEITLDEGLPRTLRWVEEKMAMETRGQGERLCAGSLA